MSEQNTVDTNAVSVVQTPDVSKTSDVSPNTNPNPVQQENTQNEKLDLIELSAEATGEVYRLSMDVASMLLAYLPRKTRSHAHRAVSEFTTGVLLFPWELVRASHRVTDQLGAIDALAKERLSNDEIINRSRAFFGYLRNTTKGVGSRIKNVSEKMSNTAEQVVEAVNSTAGQVVDTVNAWSEKKPES